MDGKMVRDHVGKSQSAMEYLMTYGWAILIIAVVLGALYSLGIFNGANFLGGTCVAAPGYLCSNPLLATDGTLSLTYGYQGPNVTIVGFACTNTTTAPSSFASSGSSNIEPGQEESVSVSCPLSSSATIGTPYSGYLWVEYDQAGQSDLIARFATVRLTATVSGAAPTPLIYAATSQGHLYVVDTANMQIIGTISLTHDGINAAPYHLVISPNYAYVYAVSSNGDNTLYTISTSTFAVTNQLTFPSQIGQGGNLAISPNGADLYVASASNANSVYVVSTATHTIVSTISANYPTCVAADTNGDYIYVGGGYTSPFYISKIQLSDDTIVNTVTTTLNQPEELEVTPNDQHLYVGTRAGPQGLDIVPSNFLVLNSGSVYLFGGLGQNIAFSPDSKYVYSGLSTQYDVSSTTNDVLIKTVGGFSDIVVTAITPNGNTLVLSDYGTDILYAYNTSTNSQIHSLNMPGDLQAIGLVIS